MNRRREWRWRLQAAMVLLAAPLLAGCLSLSPATRDLAAPDWARHEGQELIIVAVDNNEPPSLNSPGSTLRGYDAGANYAISSRARMTLTAVATDFGLQELSAWPIPSLLLHCAVFALPDQHASGELLAALQADARVRLAEPMQHYNTLSIDYNDPYVSLQRGFNTVNAAAAHERSRGQGVRIAVIDTGIDADHPDLRGQIISQRSFTGATTAADSARSDAGQAPRKLPGTSKHGTEVAGIIAALGNNREGIVGVAPAAKLLSLQACWAVDANSDRAQCNSFTLAQALSAAMDADADIVNLSLAGPADPLLSRLVEQGVKQGRIFVAALPTDGRLDGFPAGVAGVITAASARSETNAEYALPAPGREILTLTPGGHYDFASGSSMAAAHVSGAIALLLATQRDLSATAARQLLNESRNPQRDGSVDACTALARLQRALPCQPAEQPAAAALQPETVDVQSRAAKASATKATVLTGTGTY